MADKKDKLPTITTPPGVAFYPRLNSPDTKFNAEGVYSVKLLLDEANAGVPEFIQTVRTAEAGAIAEAAKQLKKGKKLKEADSPLRPYVDDEGNEVDGKWVLSAKMKASGVSKKTGKPWSRKPGLFDAKGKPSHAKVGGGSIIRLAIQLSPFDSPTIGAGISVRLEAAKIIELKSWSGEQSAAAYGFGEEEEGYDGSEESDEADTPNTDEDSGAGEGDQGEAAPPRTKGDF